MYAALLQVVDGVVETVKQLPEMPLPIAAMLILGGFLLASIVMFGKLAKFIIEEQKAIVARLDESHQRSLQAFQSEVRSIHSNQKRITAVLGKQNRAMGRLLERIESS